MRVGSGIEQDGTRWGEYFSFTFWAREFFKWEKKKMWLVRGNSELEDQISYHT